MSTAKLIKWGNSVGIRIPANDLKKINAHVGEEFEVSVTKAGGFSLTPIKSLQEGWLEAFNTIADENHDDILINHLETEFDKDEWKW